MKIGSDLLSTETQQLHSPDEHRDVLGLTNQSIVKLMSMFIEAVWDRKLFLLHMFYSCKNLSEGIVQHYGEYGYSLGYQSHVCVFSTELDSDSLML